MRAKRKKQILIYVLIAYGVTYLMGILIWYGNSNGMDVSVFPMAQMMYPAAGVMYENRKYLGACGTAFLII